MANTQVGLRAVHDGKSALNVRETSPNRGKEVDIYNQAVGNALGSSWCAAFLYYRVREASKELNVPVFLNKTGYCPALYTWASGKGLVQHHAEPGMAFLEYIPSEGGYHHTGLVATVGKDFFTTIEGNSNNDGSNNGNGVYNNTRHCDWSGKRYVFFYVEPQTGK